MVPPLVLVALKQVFWLGCLRLRKECVSDARIAAAPVLQALHEWSALCLNSGYPHAGGNPVGGI